MDMSFLDGILKKFRKKNVSEMNHDELKKVMKDRAKKMSVERPSRPKVQRSMTLESFEQPAPKVYSPSIEHPLLTIQDKLAGLEESYRRIYEKVESIDERVATGQDMEEIRALLHEGLVKEEEIIHGIDGINAKMNSYEEQKVTLEQRIEASTDQLTQDINRLGEIHDKIELLDADKKIMEYLTTTEYSTIELSEKLDLSRQYVWERLKELASAGFVDSKKVGRQTKYFILRKLDESADLSTKLPEIVDE